MNTIVEGSRVGGSAFLQTKN